MDYSIHINTISMESPFVVKGVASQNFYRMMVFFPKYYFILPNSADPGEKLINGSMCIQWSHLNMS